MAEELSGPFGDVVTLVPAGEAASIGSRHDEGALRPLLFRLLAEPGPNADVLRRMAFDPLHPSLDIDDARIVEALLDAIAMGRIVVEGQGSAGSVGGGGQSARDANAPPGADELIDADEAVDGAADENVVQPCDFDVLVIRCAHMPDANGKRKMADARFWKEGGKSQNNLPTPAAGRAYSKVIEVVGGTTDGTADDITVTLEGGPGYACGHTHPHITVKDKTGFTLEQQGTTTVTFKAKSVTHPPPAAAYANFGALLSYYYFPVQTTNHYSIDVGACGKRTDGSPGYGRDAQKVHVYPKDLYKLSLSIPPFGKASYTRARSRRPDGTLVSKREYEEERLLRGDKVTEGRTELVGRDAEGNVTSLESRDSYSVATRKGGLSEETTRRIDADSMSRSTTLKDEDPITGVGEQIGSSISFTRDGDELGGTAEIGKLINSIVNIEREIKSVMNFIKDFNRRSGWKFVFDIELFKGELSYEWGYKEWTDHTVYDYWKFQIGMTLFSLKLELSFGIEFKVWKFGVTALLYGNLAINAAVSASKESSPDDSSPWEIALESTPKGELGIRAALGSDWVKAEGKITMGVKFEATCQCSRKKPFSIDWKLHRSKVQPIVYGHVKWVGSFEKKWTWVDERKNWMRGAFPGGGDAQQRALRTNN